MNYSNQKLYRYERGIWTSHSDPYVILMDFDIIDETEKSYKITNDGVTHWISKNSKKRFAYPTPEEAMVNFVLRTKRCIKLTEVNLNKAKAFLRAAEVNTVRPIRQSLITN